MKKKQVVPDKKDASISIEKAVPRITLKPIVGIKPFVYIPIFYAILFALIIFVLSYITLVSRAGAYIKITSNPIGAAVSIDNHYYGSTPITILRPKGTYNVAVSLPYYTTHTNEFTIKNKFIVRRLFPKRIQAKLTPLAYTPNTENTIVSDTIIQLSSWNISNTQTQRYTIPSVLKDTFRMLSESQANIEKSSPDINNILTITHDLLYEALPYLAHEQYTTWQDEYEALTATSSYNTLLQNTPKLVQQSSIMKAFYNHITQSSTTTYELSASNTPSILSGTLTLEGLTFYPVPSHTIYYKQMPLEGATKLQPIQEYMEYHNSHDIVRNNNTNYLTITVPSFFIMDSEVTQQQFARFLEARNMSITEWKEQMDIYVSPHYKESHFLDYNPTLHPKRLLRYITWYDAYEYVQWLNTTLQAQGYMASLPNEYEWNAAVRTYPQKGMLNNLPDYIPEYHDNEEPVLLGNLWEWGNSWYSPYPQYSSYQGPHYGSDKHIFGGSFVTKDSDLSEIQSYNSRNMAQMPDWATPYVGFRIIITPITQQ